MRLLYYLSLSLLLSFCACTMPHTNKASHTPVDYVNPYMGNISHLLVPTYPTIHLPNSMLRVYPERTDYTGDKLHGLPLVITSHRGSSAFNLSPYQGNNPKQVIDYSYDQESIKPYYYEVFLDEEQIEIKYAPSHQSALYQIDYQQTTQPVYLMINSRNGKMEVAENHMSGYQQLANNTRVYLYLETSQMPIQSGIMEGNTISEKNVCNGSNVCAAFRFPDATSTVNLKYGISFISEEQARANMNRELADYDIEALAAKGRASWNKALGCIEVEGGDDEHKEVLYTSFYRVFERPVCISEDGRYFSAFDHQIHEDQGKPFYTDDWIWDTYRAAHPLRILVDKDAEQNVIHSYLRMAEQMGNMWMPTFPEITGDSRRMNSNHAVATVADAASKGLTLDLEKAYEACRRGIEEKTLAPWSSAPSGWIDAFYQKNGYIPALQPNETETDPNVHPFEKRQPIAVTLGTAYDEWCLSRIAEMLGRKEEAAHYLQHSYNYRNLYNEETGFFHPKDQAGQWIEPFDYRYSGGQGAREYYGENNGWVYRWDVPHNIADLIALMGGQERFAANLDQTFCEPLGKSKFEFYAQLPDHTGNVGQFSMANEPSLHIPYLYNYAGQPWKTQKRIRQLLHTWFRSDLMGVPGDEDGGGMSAFVVFSTLGFYPVTPGLPIYTIGSPIFDQARVKLSNGKYFTIIAENASQTNKYIQSATFNGQTLNRAWFTHEELMNEGVLILTMGSRPNKNWGTEGPPPTTDSFN